MKKALINIDYTNDFIASDGALTCGEPGQKIENAITKLTQQFIENGDYVVFAVDIHQKDDHYHPEAKLFPPHNIEGTDGRKLYGKLNDVFEANKEKENIYWLDKTRYSAFAGTNLEIKLRERGITELHIAGVTTDICCFHTCVEAYNKGFKIVIHEDTVASFNSDGHIWALEHFKSSLGATVI